MTIEYEPIPPGVEASDLYIGEPVRLVRRQRRREGTIEGIQFALAPYGREKVVPTLPLLPSHGVQGRGSIASVPGRGNRLEGSLQDLIPGLYGMRKAEGAWLWAKSSVGRGGVVDGGSGHPDMGAGSGGQGPRRTSH